MLGNMKAWVRANRNRLGEIGVTFMLVWLWVTLVLLVMNLYAIKTGAVGIDVLPRLRDELLPYPLKSLFADASLGESFLWALLGSCVMAPLMEETFRAGLCELCTDDATGGIKHIFVLLAGSFLGFGLLHGGGYFSIFIQGSLGLLLGRLWFRTIRRSDGTKSKAWAYASNVCVHAAYNFCVLGIQILVLRTHL
ncbi:MAG: CPBP family glutamic-type intramembrane protease [Patescibacteria group bacterium]